MNQDLMQLQLEDIMLGQMNCLILIHLDIINQNCYNLYFRAINRQPSENIPFHEDYPMNDTHWNYYETFSENFDDNDYEAM